MVTVSVIFSPAKSLTFVFPCSVRLSKLVLALSLIAAYTFPPVTRFVSLSAIAPVPSFPAHAVLSASPILPASLSALFVSSLLSALSLIAANTFPPVTRFALFSATSPVPRLVAHLPGAVIFPPSTSAFPAKSVVTFPL